MGAVLAFVSTLYSWAEHKRKRSRSDQRWKTTYNSKYRDLRATNHRSITRMRVEVPVAIEVVRQGELVSLDTVRAV